MDIAKYIGLFLLKNHYCYIHGLGNLELIKRPAYTSGKTLEAGAYEVVVTQSGSIDDSFANFIATNEQISISKAANTLREFSIQTRKDLSEGKEVVIPNIGKYVQEGNKIRFVTDDKFSFKPAGLPVLENSKRVEDQRSNTLPNIPMYPAPKKADSVNWTMVILIMVLLIIVGGGGYGIYYYFGLQKSKNAASQAVAPAPKPIVVDTTAKMQPSVAVVDSARLRDSLAANKQPTTAVTAPVDPAAMGHFQFVIGDYNTEARAQRRCVLLKEGKNTVSVKRVDSTLYYIVTDINCRVSDTLHVKDSLMVFFGYKKVHILAGQ